MHIKNSHSQKTQLPHAAKNVEMKREHILINCLIKTGHNKQLTQMRIQVFTARERLVAWGLNFFQGRNK